jgi:hypothetical protein
LQKRAAVSDYNSVEINVKFMLIHLTVNLPPCLPRTTAFLPVMEDYAHIKGKRKRYKEVRERSLPEALQNKYAQP